jgi:hypothetical protein
MTLIDDNINANVVAIESYGKIPSDDSTDVVVSTPSFKEWAGILVSLQNVNQTTPYNSTTVENSGFTSNLTSSITGTVGSIIMVVAATQGDNTITLSGAGVTQLENFSPTSGIGTVAVGYASATGSSQTLGFTVNTADNARLMLIEIYPGTPAPVENYNSASLTDGNATTNRLGSGTGSFVAGEISEDGLVDNLQITASNYTELLYSLTINSDAVADADTIDFRVLRNGAVLNTYTVTPRITIDESTTSAAITGTATASITEADIVTGGKTIIITLTGDTFLAAGTGPIGTTANTQALIDGIDSAQAEGTGWDAVVKVGIETTDVVRTSDTVATITLDAEATYNITATETITVTVPAAVLTGASPIVATPTFTISPSGSGTGILMLLGAGA